MLEWEGCEREGKEEPVCPDLCRHRKVDVNQFRTVRYLLYLLSGPVFTIELCRVALAGSS